MARWKWFARGADQPLDLIAVTAPGWSAEPTRELPVVSEAPGQRDRLQRERDEP
jgi:hypothetical protein